MNRLHHVVSSVVFVFCLGMLVVGAPSSVDAQGQNIANGEWCGKAGETDDKNCASGACYPSPGTGEWGICMAQGKNCAWPGTDGYTYKALKEWRGKPVECMDLDGSKNRARFAPHKKEQ